MEDRKSSLEIISPNLPKELDMLSIFDKCILSEDSFTRGIISNGLCKDQNADHVSFNKVLFKNVKFDNVSFKCLDLVDVRFENCDLSNVNFSESVIHKAEMINCKMVGMNMSDSALRNVLFDECDGSYALFRFLDCKQVNFNNCSLCSADFYKAKFSKVAFHNSNLQQTGMSGACLKGIDLSSCKIDGLGVAIDDLDGCIVSPEQVISFSKLLGLIIKS
ncbi:putative low-complexity protein [Desulfosporosinus orientis DSM 765]|uniref:Putative low-complexity protein n=1 Tax=Desulfosporosinus orientis (strain ATCC 19365 / DSM 765 / NCIMB 8382 / VKM B-1628 / Singapore I) TaxID=768706 RepID=G7W701_DESOD|nr:pentapeptide repeat-containing protein [Desulfosporosinus orientis]AET69858.1 putative low-complexity protein [Desulfosporosinus orientis DSM 765]